MRPCIGAWLDEVEEYLCSCRNHHRRCPGRRCSGKRCDRPRYGFSWRFSTAFRNVGACFWGHHRK